MNETWYLKKHMVKLAYINNWLIMNIPAWKPFTFEVLFKEWLAVFKLSWDAGLIDADIIFEKISEETDLFNKAVLDLWELDYCNSRFLGQLFSLADNVDKKHWKLCINRCNDMILETLTIVWMFDVIPMFETLSESREYLISPKG
jgi:anti-anti-sigma regulatory factor